MEINRNNYGAFFLDYWESNLDPRGLKALTLFLEKNPDLQDEFLDFGHSVDSKLTDDDDLIFPNKRLLKKIQVEAHGEINQHNWEQYVIAHLEHDLNPSQIMLFEDFLSSNPQIAGEVELFKKTYLKPDQHIVYDQKGALKRRAIPVWWSLPAVKWGVSSAAILLIALSLVWNTPEIRIKDTGTPQLTESQAIENINGNVPLTVEEEENNTTVVNPSSQQPFEIARFEPSEKMKPAVPSSQKPEESFPVQSVTELRQELPITGLSSRNLPGSIPVNNLQATAITQRDEFGQVFEFLLIRDGLTYVDDQPQSNIGRMIAAIGNQLPGNRPKPVENLFNPVLAAVAETGKTILTNTSEILPVYQTTEDSGRKETYFAVSENFNIRLSRSKTAEP